MSPRARGIILSHVEEQHVVALRHRGRSAGSNARYASNQCWRPLQTKLMISGNLMHLPCSGNNEYSSIPVARKIGIARLGLNHHVKGRILFAYKFTDLCFWVE